MKEYSLKKIAGVNWNESEYLTCTLVKEEGRYHATCAVRARHAVFSSRTVEFSPVGCDIVMCREAEKPSISIDDNGSPKRLRLPEGDLKRAIPEMDAFAYCARPVKEQFKAKLASYCSEYIHRARDEGGEIWLVLLEEGRAAWDGLIGVKLAETRISITECGSEAELHYYQKSIGDGYEAKLSIPAECLAKMCAKG